MDEIIIFLLGMLAEALGLKAKRPAVPRTAPGPAAPGPPRPAPGPPSFPPANVPGRPAPGRDIPARRPDAGSPLDAVPSRRPADSLAAEPRGLEVRISSEADTTAPPSPLLADQASLIRAIILQEVLAPPLCRRPGKPPPATDNPHGR